MQQESPLTSELTAEQREKAVAWLNEKAPIVGKCPICSNRQWSVLEDFIHAPVFYTGGGMVVGGKSYPCFGIICNSCGNTHFINAVVAGLIDGAPK